MLYVINYFGSGESSVNCNEGSFGRLLLSKGGSSMFDSTCFGLGSWINNGMSDEEMILEMFVGDGLS